MTSLMMAVVSIYHSISAVLQPLFTGMTPSATALKNALVAFYGQKGQFCKSMERLLTITFDDRLKDVK